MIYPTWLNPADNAWQMTAATLVGLMSVPGLVVLYGGVMQKRWSVNSMMMAFITFAVVLIAWVLYGFKMGFGNPLQSGASGEESFFGNFVGHARHDTGQGSDLLGAGQATDPAARRHRQAWRFPAVDADVLPVRLRGDHADPLMLGSVLGRINFKAWIPVPCCCGRGWIYTVNAFLIWGGGYFAQHGALDFSGGYVIHLAAGVSGFVAACGRRAPPGSGTARSSTPTTSPWWRSVPACCGSVGTASTAATPIWPTRG